MAAGSRDIALVTALLPPKTDYRVLAESDDWMVLDKPAPLIVHAVRDPLELNLLGELQKKRPGEDFFLINRLDRETSGCVLLAKNRDVAGILGKEMHHHRIKKSYHAIVKGWPEWDEITVDVCMLPMEKVQETEIWVRQMIHTSGKPSRTRFVVEDRFGRDGARFSLVKCYPQTGRTHQIRLHLEHLQHYLIGDKIYGGDSTCYLDFLAQGWTPALEERVLLSRQALHASSMSFSWLGQDVEVSCSMPEDLKQFLIGE